MTAVMHSCVTTAAMHSCHTQLCNQSCIIQAVMEWVAVTVTMADFIDLSEQANLALFLENTLDEMCSFKLTHAMSIFTFINN
jgi:hypothetical protein